ncbi:hypothetical protein OVA24_02505 [Luteolibacter sp. SL250]|uniref:outer membrane beta-barrel protein n=1 Tax=Luteolibacter sp. SL250 TaxID=2995170 RepID=UPI00226E6A4A|nr:hypothetical protein [Luteolibacter sp. SL250]WAC20251.1 hypothetical protein OVA24_02505 [Luteolibacter sp. SL250]
MKKAFLLASLMTTSAMATEFNYTNIDIGYLNGKADLPREYATLFALDDELDTEGFFVNARFEFTENFFGYVRYENGEIRTETLGGVNFDADLWRLEAGFGGALPLADTLDVYYGIGYKYTDLDFGNLGDQNLGNVDLHVGLRWAPFAWIELNPHLGYSLGVDNDDVLGAVDVATAGINLFVTAFDYVQPFGGITYELDSSSDNIVKDQVLYSAGLRFSF